MTFGGLSARNRARNGMGLGQNWPKPWTVWAALSACYPRNPWFRVDLTLQPAHTGRRIRHFPPRPLSVLGGRRGRYNDARVVPRGGRTRGTICGVDFVAQRLGAAGRDGVAPDVGPIAHRRRRLAPGSGA